MVPDGQQPDRHAGPFASTHWSLVIAAGDAASPAATEALEQLCTTYWQPLYWHVRRLGHHAAEAQDLTQAFFERVLERQLIAAADQSRGKFRAFLLTSLKNFLTNEREREQALKRGGGLKVFAMDFSSAESYFQLEPADPQTAEKVFDRQWAIAVLEAALYSLEQRHRAAGKQLLFDALVPCMTASDDAPRHNQIADEFGMSIAAVKKAVSRMRAQYAAAIRQEVAATLPTGVGVEDEIKELFQALKR